jgi:hypothetical protein
MWGALWSKIFYSSYFSKPRGVLGAIGKHNMKDVGVFFLRLTRHLEVIQSNVFMCGKILYSRHSMVHHNTIQVTRSWDFDLVFEVAQSHHTKQCPCDNES